jgi:chemotaxis protein MotB
MLRRKRAVEHEEVDSEGTWAVSYGDMVTLLLTFFIVFFSTDDKKASKQKVQLKMSLIEQLNNRSQTSPDRGSSPRLRLGRKEEEGIDRDVLKRLSGVAQDKGSHILVDFPFVSFFNSGEVQLSDEGEKAIMNFVKVYTPYAGNYVVGIRAFADARPVRQLEGRRYRDNLELTALRSVAAMRVLQKAGVPLSRIRTGGYGEMVVTAQELADMPANRSKPRSELDLARKIVLVIEPETDP